MSFELGQIITGEQPTYRLASLWCNSNNATIVALDGAGYQIVAIPAPTTGELAAKVRTERDARITACDWIISRHAEQVALGVDTTLTAESYAAWLAYRQELRDMPSVDGFPWDGGGEDTPWPVGPES